MLATMLAATLMAPQPLRMSAWLIFWDPRSLDTMEREAELLSDVMAEAYVVTLDGDVARRPLPTPEQRARTRAIAAKHGITVYGMVSNYIEDGFKAEPVQKALQNPEVRARHIQNMVRMAREDGYQGLDIDLESLKATDRAAFTQYMTELREATRKAGLKLSIALHPKESEPGGWDGAIAKDWPKIGPLVDVFRVMCYDFSWSGSAPGPIAPPDWVERVARHAATTVGAARVEMGIPGYGYVWDKPGPGPARSMSYADWNGWLAGLTGNPKPTRHASGELTLNVGESTGFFSDAAAQEPKFGIARTLGLRGFALWRLGSEDPQLWPLFRRLR